MTENDGIKKIILILGLVLLALLVIVQIITARGNVLAQFYLFTAIGALLYGLAYPKQAIYVSLFTTCYIDLFKRLMVLDARAVPTDLYYVLGIPPLLVFGSLVTTIISVIMRRGSIPRDLIYGAICTILFFALAAISAGGLSGGGARSMGDVVNTGVYSCFLILIPRYFPTAEDKKKLLYYIMWLFVPVALYMFRHRYFGLAKFEYDYLLSGLTIEVRVLYDQAALRGFSTMNGGAVVSTFLSLMVLLSQIPVQPASVPISPVNRAIRVCLGLLFMVAAYFTVSRAGWFSGLAAILVYAFLAKRFTAVMGTVIGVGSVVAVILCAPLIVKYNILGAIETSLQEVVLGSDGGDDFSQRAIVMGTMNARLDGWINLTQKPELYTPFGFHFAGQKLGATDFFWGHDLIVDTLIMVGYVPIILLLFVVGLGLRLCYRYYFGLDQGSLERKIVRISFAFVVGILIGGLSNGAQLRVFPQNFYFFLFVAFIFSSYMNYSMRQRQEKLQAAPNPHGFPQPPASSEAGGYAWRRRQS